MKKKVIIGIILVLIIIATIVTLVILNSNKIKPEDSFNTYFALSTKVIKSIILGIIKLFPFLIFDQILYKIYK